MSEVAVELKGLSKAFGACVANADISLSVARGTVHAVIGENGAGKSTAMKMLYGMYSPDSGEIRVGGKARKWRSSSDAIAAGIGMVHQHFMLAGPYTALENIVLGAEDLAGFGFSFLPRALRPVDWSRARAEISELSRKHGLAVDLDALIEDLPVGVQQRVEILKLLYRKADILIMDEPTAVLTPQETSELFANLRKMVESEGKTVLIITHKLKEVMSFSDEITVFRAGRVVGRVRTSETNPEELASLMVGRKVSLRVERGERAIQTHAQPIVAVRGLTLEGAGSSKRVLSGVSFSIRPGEILGIAGVEGNGQSELLHALLQPRDYRGRISGGIRILGHETLELGAREIKDLGVGVIPEDRLKEGLLPERPVDENFVLGLHRTKLFSRAGFLSWKQVAVDGARALDEFDVRPRSLETLAGRLSGGNQQKLIIARELKREPKFLIAAQPTRGVDVGAIEFIHRRILDASLAGSGVLVVSSELDEVIGLSDRVIVLYEGRVVAEIDRNPEGFSEKDIGFQMSGAGGHA